MSKHIISKTAVCPFYLWHENNRICCEGTDETNTIYLAFGDLKDCKEYRERYCKDLMGCTHCMLYQMLDRKYPEGG